MCLMYSLEINSHITLTTVTFVFIVQLTGRKGDGGGEKGPGMLLSQPNFLHFHAVLGNNMLVPPLTGTNLTLWVYSRGRV